MSYDPPIDWIIIRLKVIDKYEENTWIVWRILKMNGVWYIMEWVDIMNQKKLRNSWINT